MTAVYWLGAPGVSQLEYPPGSGTLYNVGALIPEMTEAEARALVPLGHSFQVPSVYPYGTPAMAPAAAATSMRVPVVAARTGEPTGSEAGTIYGGPAPQSAWVPAESYAAPPPPSVPAGTLVNTAAGQADWPHAEMQPAEEVVAVAVPSEPTATVEQTQDEEVVAVSVPTTEEEELPSFEEPSAEEPPPDAEAY